MIQNKNKIVQHKTGNSENLFSDLTMEVSTNVFLLPEFKNADYFLKIENNDGAMNVSKIQILLNTIDSVSTVYLVDTSKIKSKNNLIF